MDKNPYLHVVGEPRMMKGEGAPRSTVFGVLGHTKPDDKMRSLGGLVENAKASAAMPPTIKDSKIHHNTERHTIGPASKTHVPGAHFGMVPYAGLYMSKLGHRV